MLDESDVVSLGDPVVEELVDLLGDERFPVFDGYLPLKFFLASKLADALAGLHGVKTVPTFAAIKTANISPNVQQVRTLAYGAAAMGGEVYVVTPNTGETAYRTQAADGRWWERDPTGPVNPAVFGAQGDGADDNAALTAASAYLSARGGGCVDLMGRTWKVTASPVIHAANTEFRNGTIDATGVADYINGARHCMSPIAASGSLGTNLALLSQSTVRGQMEAIFATDPGLSRGDPVLVGMNPPICTVTSPVGTSDTTITVNDTTAFSDTGGLFWNGQEEITYTAKTPTSFTGCRRGVGNFNRGGKAMPNGTVLCEAHTGKVSMHDLFPVSKAEYKTVYGSRQLTSGETCVLFNEPFDDIYSPVCGGWIAKITPVRNLKLTDVTCINGDATTSRVGTGLGECGPYYRYVDGLVITNVRQSGGSMANGVLDSCFNFQISGNFTQGKADQDSLGVYDWYAWSLTNCCTYGIVSRNIAHDTFQHTTLWASRYVASPDYWGACRHIQIAENLYDNSGMPWHSQHYGFAIHGGDVEHIDFASNNVRNCKNAYELQGGSYITITGGEVSGWAQSVIHLGNGFYNRGIKVQGVNATNRWKGAGNTVLDGGINSSVTTITFKHGAPELAYLSGASLMCMKIDSEVIALGTASADGLTYSGCTRGWGRTTAASHSDGAKVSPFGLTSALPLDVTLCDTGFYKESPDRNATYLTTAATSGDTSLAVNDVRCFDTPIDASHPLLAVIMGERTSDSYQPEVVSYTGITPGTGNQGTLTGVVRGLMGTPAVSHLINLHVMQYSCGAVGLEFDFSCTLDLDINGVINFRNAVPTKNVVCGVTATFTDPTHRAQSPAIVCSSHGVTIRGSNLDGFAWGIDMTGSDMTARDNNIRLSGTDLVGNTGIFVRSGSVRNRVIGNAFSRLYCGVQVQAGASLALVAANVGAGLGGGGIVTDAGTGTVTSGNIAA